MSRVHFTSRQLIIQSERMDPWGHEDRSSFGGCSQLPSRPLRNRYDDQILFGDGTRSWVMIVSGTNKNVTEMTEETKRTTSTTLEKAQGNLLLKKDRNKHQCRRLLLRRLRYHITCASGSTSNQVSTTKAVSKCQKDDQIASTRSFSASRRRRSSRIQDLGTDVSFRIYVFSVLVNSGTAELLAKKEEVLRRDFSIVWIHTPLIPSLSFEQVKATLDENAFTLHCKTTCRYRAASPSMSSTLEAPTIRTR